MIIVTLKKQRKLEVSLLELFIVSFVKEVIYMYLNLSSLNSYKSGKVMDEK